MAASGKVSGTAIALPAVVTPSPTASRRSGSSSGGGGGGVGSGANGGHIRSSSLENAHSFNAKNTLGLPAVLAARVTHCGTLKSRNEQKRMRNKFGSHSNLDDFVQQGGASAAGGGGGGGGGGLQRGSAKFHNIRQMFELSRSVHLDRCDSVELQQMQSLPPTMTAISTPPPQPQPLANAAASAPTAAQATQRGAHAMQQQQQHMQHVYQQQYAAAHQQQQKQQQQQQQQQQPQPQPQLQSKSKPKALAAAAGTACTPPNAALTANGNRHSIADPQGNEHASSGDCCAQVIAATPTQQQSQRHNAPMQIQHPQQQQPQQQQPQQQQPQQQQPQFYTTTSQQQQRAAAATAHLQRDVETSNQVTNLLRPIAFKPIPFQPDYSIANRYCYDLVATAGNGGGIGGGAGGGVVMDRYGSTPSLAPTQNATLRFGSTTDLRHGGCAVIGNGTGLAATTHAGIGGGIGGIGGGIGGGGGSTTGFMLGGCVADGVGVGVGAGVGGYASNNYYCNSLMARRRGGSRSLKINDSMESIRRSTPDSDAHSQSSAIKATCGTHTTTQTLPPHNFGNHNVHNTCVNGVNGTSTITANANNNGNNNNGNSSNSNTNTNNINNNKYMMTLSSGSTSGSGSGGEQCNMTPSPSDSGISDLEAALKDRDSELSYLRQAMDHNNEKDKDAYWEGENKRLRCFYDGQQREYALKLKKLEQMLAMQQFQFKQHKMKHTEHANKLREQLADLKTENEILRSNNGSLKNSERNLKDRAAYIEEQLKETQNLIVALKAQLEENEWRVCERNGEIALLKSQLKEANVEITLKEHALVHLKHETNTTNGMHTQQQQQLQQQQHQQQQTNNSKSNNESNRNAEIELRQMNKIIILKDQVILALTNELAKLRKELSDLAIFHEYGEEPSGKYMRLKQQLESLTDICNRTRRQAQKTLANAHAGGAKEHMVDETNLELIMNCLKLAPTLSDDEPLAVSSTTSTTSTISTTSSSSSEDADVVGDGEYVLKQLLSGEKRLSKMSADIQKFAYGGQAHCPNLPDVALMNEQPPLNYTKYKQHQQLHPHHHNYGGHHQTLEESTLDTLIEESAGYAEEIGKLRKQLDDVRVNFELEKRQWCEEKEKVLNYQKQLQAHYISMYQKLRSLESCSAAEEV